MRTFLDDIEEKAIARGRTEGEAKGAIKALLDLATHGRITKTIAEDVLRAYISAGDIPDALGREAIIRLNAET